MNACIYDPIVSKNEIFNNSESQLTKSLVYTLNSKFKSPEFEIIEEGAQPDYMYFLVYGEVCVLVTDQNNVKHEICYLHPGAHFGEIGMIYNILRTATVKSLTYCNIAYLKKANYEKIATKFPEFEEKLKSWTDVYRDPWKAYIFEILN